MIDRRQVIRHIACSYDGPIVAVAEFERYVQIWDITSQRRIATYETTLDFGGKRLAITRDGKHCVIGAYHVHGIALYDASNGTEVWRRKDLKKVQRIRLSKDDQRILCGFEGKAFEQLNLATGRSKPSLHGVSDVVESVYDAIALIDRKSRDYKLTTDANQQIATIPRKTFAALDFAFAPQKLCISESGGSIRCFDTTDGKQLWEHDPGDGVHALVITYNESNQVFVAVTWPYEKGGEHQLVILNANTGHSASVATITGAYEFAFCCKGTSLISSDGKLRDTATGDVQAVLDFFQTEEQAD